MSLATKKKSQQVAQISKSPNHILNGTLNFSVPSTIKLPLTIPLGEGEEREREREREKGRKMGKCLGRDCGRGDWRRLERGMEIIGDRELGLKKITKE